MSIETWPKNVYSGTSAQKDLILTNGSERLKQGIHACNGVAPIEDKEEISYITLTAFKY
jgi:hypothetical protein